MQILNIKIMFELPGHANKNALTCANCAQPVTCANCDMCKLYTAHVLFLLVHKLHSPEFHSMHYKYKGKTRLLPHRWSCPA